MKRKLYIHIGVQRTATTSIQSFLKNNHAALQAQGILQYNGVPRHLPMMLGLFDGSLKITEAIRRITAQADAAPSDIHSVTLSEEDICSRGGFATLAKFRDAFDVKLVLVMRRQDLLIESWYRQNVKWQWNPELCHLRFDAFLAQRKRFDWVHYDRLLDRLEPLFGQDNILPLVFEPAQMPDGPLAAFCAAVGVPDPASLTYPQHRRNASPSPLMGEFMRNLPLDEFPENYRLRVEKACLHADWYVKQKSGPQSALFMDLETRKTVLAEYAAGNADIAKRYFGRTDLFEEPLPEADAPLAPQNLPADSYALMADYVTPFLRALIDATAQADDARR